MYGLAELKKGFFKFTSAESERFQQDGVRRSQFY